MEQDEKSFQSELLAEGLEDVVRANDKEMQLKNNALKGMESKHLGLKFMVRAKEAKLRLLTSQIKQHDDSHGCKDMESKHSELELLRTVKEEKIEQLTNQIKEHENYHACTDVESKHSALKTLVTAEEGKLRLLTSQIKEHEDCHGCKGLVSKHAGVEFLAKGKEARSRLLTSQIKEHEGSHAYKVLDPKPNGKISENETVQENVDMLMSREQAWPDELGQIITNKDQLVSSFTLRIEELKICLREKEADAKVLDQGFQDKVSENKTLRGLVDKLTAKIESLEKWEMEALEKTKLCKDIKSKCSFLDEKLQESTARLKDVEQQYITVQKNLSEAVEKATEKDILIAKLDQVLSTNAVEVKRLEEALKAEKARQSKKMDAMMVAEIQQRDDHIKFLKEENLCIQQLLNAAEQERDQSMNAYTELEFKFDTVQTEHKLKLEEQACKHAEDYSALNLLLKENQIRLQEITEARKEDDMQLAAWAKTYSELECRFSQISEELDSSKLSLSSAMEKEQGLSTEVTRLHDQLNEMKKSEEDNLHEISFKHEARLENAKETIHGLQTQTEQARQQMALLEAEKDRALDESQQIQQSKDSEIADLSQAIAELNKETEMLKKSFAKQVISSAQTFKNFQKEASENKAQLQNEVVELTKKDKKLQEKINLVSDEKKKICNEMNLQLQNINQKCLETEEKLLLEQRRNVQLVSEKDKELGATKLQLESFKKSVSTLSTEKGQLELLFQEKEKVIQNLLLSVSNGNDKLEKLQDSVNAKDSELSKSFAEISKFKNMCQSISSKLWNTEKQSENLLKGKVQEFDNVLFQREKENQNLTTANNALRVLLEKKDIEIERLEVAGNESDANLADFKLQIASIHDQLRLKSTQTDELHARCTGLSEELNDTNKALAYATRENENLKKVISNKENEVEKLSSKLNFETEEVRLLRKLIEQKSKELDTLETELEKRDEDTMALELQQQSSLKTIDALNACLRENDEVSTLLNQKLISSEKQMQEYKRILKDKELAMAQNDKTIENLLAEVTFFKDKLACSDDFMKSLNIESESLRSTLEEKNTMCATLNEDLRAVNEKCAILEKETECLKVKVEGSLVYIENHNHQLLEKLKENDGRIHQLQDDLCGREEELESANQKVSLLQMEIAELCDANFEKEKRQEDDVLQKCSVEHTNNELTPRDANEVSENDLQAKISKLKLQLKGKSKSLLESRRKLKVSRFSRKRLLEKVRVAGNKLNEYEQHSPRINDVPKEMNKSLNQSFDSVPSTSAKDSDKGLLDEPSALSLKISELNENKKNMESEFLKEKQELDEREKELKTVNLDLVSECDNLKKKVKEEEIQYLRNCLDESERSSADSIHFKKTLMTRQVSHEEIRNRQLEMEGTRAECEKLSVLSTSLLEEVDASASMHESLKVEYERKSNECENLQDDLSSLPDQKSKLDEDLQGSRSQIQELENNLQKKEKLVLQLQGKSDHKELIQGNNEVDNLWSLFNEQKERNSEMNIRISNLEHDLMKSEKEADKLREECDHLQASLNEEKQLSIQRQEEITNLKDKVFKKSADIENPQSNVNDTKSMMEQETDALNSSLSDIQKERDYLQEEVGMLRKKKEHDSFLAKTEKIQLLQTTSDDAVKEKEQFRRKLKAALVSRKKLILQEKQLKEELSTLKGYKKNFDETENILSKMRLQEDKRDAELTEMKSRREKDIQILKDSLKKVSDLEKKDRRNLMTIQSNRKLMLHQLSELERLRSKERVILSLKSCNIILSAKNESLQEKLEEDVEVIRNLQNELKLIQEGKSGGVFSNDLEEMQYRLEAAEWDNGILMEKVNRLANEKKKKESKLIEVLEDFEQESIAKQEATSRCDDLQKQLMKLQFDLDARQQEKTKQSVVLSEDVVVLQDLVKEENTVLKDSPDNIKAGLDKTRIERDALKKESRDFLLDSHHSTEILLLQEENKALKQSLRLLDNGAAEYSRELDHSRMEQERLKKEFGPGSLQEVQVVLAAYLEDINDLKANLLASYAELEEKILRNEQLEGESHTKEKKIAKLLLEVESLNKELESYTGMVRNLRADLEEQMLEKGTLLLELEVIKCAEESLKKDAKIQELRNEISTLMDLDREKSSLVSHLQEDAQVRKVELESQSSHLCEKENLVQLLEKEKDRALSDLADKASIFEGIQVEISLTRSKFQDASAELEAKDSALRAILGDKQQLSIDMMTCQKKIMNLKEENTSLATVIEKYEQELEKISSDMKKMRSEAMNLKEENSSLKTDVEKYKQDWTVISGSFSSLVETNKDRSHRLETAEQSLSFLTGELSALDDKYSTASLIMDEVRKKMVPGAKIQTEILVQSAQLGDEKSPLGLISPGLLKDGNPWMSLQRKMDDFEDALKWMSTSKKEAEDKTLELENLYRNLKVDYTGSEAKLNEVQSSLLEARTKVQESEMLRERLSQDAREEIEKRERALEDMNAGLKSLDVALNTEKGRTRILEGKAEKLKEQNNALAASLESAQSRIQTLESSTGHIQHLQIAEQKLLAQNTELEQLSAERQQLGGQLNDLHASLQDYQAKYANLHAEYLKIANEHNKCNRMDGAIKCFQAASLTTNGAPGGPPVKGMPEAEELLQNLRMDKRKAVGEVSLHMFPIILSDEEDVISLRPTSVTRRVHSSTSGSFARWLRGRSLRWANPSKTRSCPHFKPLSFKTLGVFYMVVLQVLLIKCFFL